MPDTLVEGKKLVETPQIQRHHRAELAARGVEPTDDVGATAERDDGDAMLGAVAQDRGDLVVVAGQQDRVGRVLYAGVFAPQHVGGGLAASVQQPVAVRSAEVLGAHDRGQRILICLRQRGRAQLDLVGFEFGSTRILEAHSLLQQSPDPIGKRFGRSGISPRVPFHRRKEFLEVRHALQYYICCQ